MARDITKTILLGAAMFTCQAAYARDARILTLPRHSQLTPVQRLNREGVAAVKKHDYPRAEQLFYKAYLYDPADPFTLNNLGYISELDGQLDRAQKFYDLAAQQGSDANIDLSSEAHLQGQPMRAALIDLKDAAMRVNRMNLSAMRLLEQDRGFEAVAMLHQALALDPRNAFTLNNLGVASEAVGDLNSALKYYQQAAALHSAEPAAVTLDRNWRGKSVSSMAGASAAQLQRRVRSLDPSEEKAVMYTLRGVYAENQNNWPAARDAFLQAYELDPASAFCINNRGYIAEREGDLESAEFFYEKARKGENASAPVGLATSVDAQGKPLATVANDSNAKVDTAIDIYSRQRRQDGAPVELTPRGDGAQPENQAPNAPPSSQQPPL